MTLSTVALLGSQAVLGLVGLGVGGAKVTSRAGQVNEFRRFGYPQWFRVGTGILEIGAGVGLIGGWCGRPGSRWQVASS